MRRFKSEAEASLARVVGGAIADECESSTIDFKEQKTSPSEMEKLIAEAAICFANAVGGTIIVGVADKIKGPAALTGTNLTPERIRKRVWELSRPSILVEVERHYLYENVLLVFVSQSPEIHSDTQGRAYLRVEKDCLPMLPNQQARLREERQGVDWSSAPSGRMISEISPKIILEAQSILQKFNDERRILATLSASDLLSALKVVVSSTELNRAGALLFCEPEAHEKDAIVYQYRSTPGGETRSSQRLRTPLLTAFSKTMELIGARQVLTPVTLPDGQQITIEDFPSLAIREALSNAVCHRDYHLDAPIAVDHSPEVFVLTSPGPLVSGVTLENIITVPSRPRNAALAHAARILGLAEEFGRGVDRMYREMIRSGRGVPSIEANFDLVRVALIGGAPDTNIAKFVSSLPEVDRDDTDTMLVIFRLCSQKNIDAYSIAPILQKTAEEAEAVLRRLGAGDAPLIERARGAPGRATPSYRLQGEVLRALGAAVRYQRRTTDEIDRKVIAHVREYGKITNRTLQNFFDVHVYRARDIIADLVQREILVRVSPQQRGPAVEWGAGAKFPVAKPRARRAKAAPAAQEPNDENE